MVFVQLAVKGAPAHAQSLGRQRAVSVGCFQGADDELPLGFFHGQTIARQRPLRVWPRRRVAAPPRAATAGKSRAVILSPAAQHHGVLDGRAQLAHVARPLILHQQLQRIRGKAVHWLVVLLG